MTAFGPDLPRLTELAAGVQRLLAPNPSVMTGPGTNTYLVGTDDIAVIDPGPNIESHLDAIVEAANGTIRSIVVTHTHPDHSPAAAALAGRTGAELYGQPAPDGEHQDKSFVPDRVMNDGDSLQVGELRLEAIHTPGHASNHVCYRLLPQNWILTGDHVIDGSTVVINPPDGNMKAYIESLRRVQSKEPDALLPGHGDVISNVDEVIDWIVDHRLEREAKVLAALRANPGLTSMQLVAHVYQDVDERLYPLAERSLFAHLIKLQEDGVASCNDETWLA